MIQASKRGQSCCRLDNGFAPWKKVSKTAAPASRTLKVATAETTILRTSPVPHWQASSAVMSLRRQAHQILQQL